MSALDWASLMRAGLAQLRLRPDEFWRLTPAEFLVLAGRGVMHSPTTRETLERLVREFPDGRKAK